MDIFTAELTSVFTAVFRLGSADGAGASDVVGRLAGLELLSRPLLLTRGIAAAGDAGGSSAAGAGAGATSSGAAAGAAGSGAASSAAAGAASGAAGASATGSSASAMRSGRGNKMPLPRQRCRRHAASASAQTMLDECQGVLLACWLPIEQAVMWSSTQPCSRRRCSSHLWSPAKAPAVRA